MLSYLDLRGFQVSAVSCQRTVSRRRRDTSPIADDVSNAAAFKCMLAVEIVSYKRGMGAGFLTRSTTRLLTQIQLFAVS